MDFEAARANMIEQQIRPWNVLEMQTLSALGAVRREDFVPTTHREYAENAFELRGGCGFSFGNDCSDGTSESSLFGGRKKKFIPIKSDQ